MQKQQNVRKKQKKIVKANIPHYNVIYCSIFGSSIQKLQESARFVVPQRVAGSLGTSADLEKGGGVTGARPHLTWTWHSKRAQPTERKTHRLARQPTVIRLDTSKISHSRSATQTKRIASRALQQVRAKRFPQKDHSQCLSRATTINRTIRPPPRHLQFVSVHLISFVIHISETNKYFWIWSDGANEHLKIPIAETETHTRAFCN